MGSERGSEHEEDKKMASTVDKRKSNTNTMEEKTLPLAVDLDGTLVKTDTLVESILILLKQQPIAFVFRYYYGFYEGKHSSNNKLPPGLNYR